MSGKDQSRDCVLDGYKGVLLVIFEELVVRYTIASHPKHTKKISRDNIINHFNSHSSHIHTTPPTMSNQSNQSKIDRNQANLPLPEQPPVASDWNSMDETKVNVGSGRVESHSGTGPHAMTGTQGAAVNTESAENEMSKIGREGKDNLSGPPKDAKY